MIVFKIHINQLQGIIKMICRDLRDYLYQLSQRGFSIIKTKKHITVVHPTGKKFSCSSTPSAGNAHKELFRDIRRYEVQNNIQERVA